MFGNSIYFIVWWEHKIIHLLQYIPNVKRIEFLCFHRAEKSNHFNFNISLWDLSTRSTRQMQMNFD